MENPIKGSIEVLLEQFREAATADEVSMLHRQILTLIKKRSNPITIGTTTHFFFRKNHDGDISVIGDWNKWQPGVDTLHPLNEHSDIYHVEKEFPIDARLPYRFIAGDESLLDPLNANISNGPLGTNSYFQMSGCSNIPYLNVPAKKIPVGKIESFEVAGNNKIAKRTVQVYFPSGYKKSPDQRILYVNDGAEAITIGKFTTILDNLYYYEPKLDATIVVFVPPVDRHAEYMFNDTFTKWFATTLVKVVEQTIGIKSSARYRAIQGASLGGLFSAHVGLKHSRIFGNIIAQSSSFWVNEQQIISEYAAIKKLPLRFFVHTGTINDAQEGSREMLEVLQDKGYEVTYLETTESHNWMNWSAQYAEMIRWLCDVR